MDRRDVVRGAAGVVLGVLAVPLRAAAMHMPTHGYTHAADTTSAPDSRADARTS